MATAAFMLTTFFLLRTLHHASPDDSADLGGLASTARGASTTSPADERRPDPSPATPSPSTPRPPPQNFSRLSLYDQLAYQYPYDVEAKFPAYIWQTWKWTPADPAFRFRDQEATWTEQHPGFVHEVITDRVAAQLLTLLYGAVPRVLEAYESLPLPVLKADFFRYLILLARGGIYTDIDTYAIRSAVEWIPASVPHETVGLVIGIEADPNRPDWKDWYSRRIQFCQWTIQAKPGHPVLRDVVVRITEETLRRKRTGELRSLRDKGVVEFTGPAVWTDVIFDYFNDPRYFDMENSPGPIDYTNFTGMESPKKVGDVIVLPITSFSPGVRQMGAKDYDDPMAFVKHDFEGELSLALK